MIAFVNAHTHIYSALAPYGMPPPAAAPANFVEILERVWWPLDRAIDERALDVSARLYAAESLLAGTTVLIDHHESPNFIEGSLDVIADACQALGMRALVCFGATERNGGRDEARRGLAECRRFILGNRRTLVRGAVGLHASFTVSDETIRESGDLCRDLGAVLHVHLAEDKADVDDARARGYAGPLERLMDLGTLVRGSILAHGVHLDRDQVAVADGAGAWFVQNARSNQGNRVGYPSALAASTRVALGTDGYPADMVAEARAAIETGDQHGEPPGLALARLRNGHALAAPFFDLPVDVGAGLPADVGAGFSRPATPAWPGDDLEAWRTTCLSYYEADGRPIVHDGRLLTADLDALRAEARVEAARLWARLREVSS